MKDGLYQVTTPYLCAGFVVEGGKVTHCAPILRKKIGYWMTKAKLIMKEEDGVDHINIYSKGKTALGRALSNFADIGFEHPEYGEFRSVEGFWYWLRTGKQHDSLRGLAGYDAKAEGKKYSRIETQDDVFKKEIKEALRLKLRQNKWLLNMLTESTLPLKHYYNYNGKIVLLPQYEWIVDEFERIRQTMKEWKTAKRTTSASC